METVDVFDGGTASVCWLPTAQLSMCETAFATQRRFLALYLRSLWGRDFMLTTLPRIVRPRLASNTLYFPEHVRGSDVFANKRLYQAMAMHLAAHEVYGKRAFKNVDQFDYEARTIIEWIEDARVEQNVMHSFPGIRKQWLPFLMSLRTLPLQGVPGNLLLQLQYALFDKRYVMSDVRLAAWARRFHECIMFNRYNSALSINLGYELRDILYQCGVGGDISLLKAMLKPAYRDDGDCLWRVHCG
ncbi:MAG: hypothetical protein OEW58_11165 [Gammaproteobacteria bacterium]|nr:hypothetical protein [Gammaproteobacteria bacterium]